LVIELTGTKQKKRHKKKTRIKFHRQQHNYLNRVESRHLLTSAVHKLLKRKMTIKNDTVASGKGGEPEIVVDSLVDQLEQDIVVGMAEAEPSVPFASATPLDEQVAMATIDPSNKPTYPVPAVVVPTTSIATATTAYTSTTTPSAVGQAGAAQFSQVPPNAPAGGRWVQRNFIGPTTWTITSIVSLVTCFCVCLPCGFWGLLCPCDTKRVYISQGRAYDENGTVLGPG
jgi:hypothetical protein